MVADMLIQEFERRRAANRRYSLRAFARSFGMSHTIVSLVMRHKRDPSRGFVRKVQRVLPGAGGQEIGFKITDRNLLGTEDFSRVASWLHYAILSYLDIGGDKIEPKTLARVLAVAPFQVERAIEDLKSSGLINKDKRGRYMQSRPPFVVANRKVDPANREFARGYLKKAEESLDYVRFDHRDIRSMTFTMNSKDLDYARERLMKFRQELSKELETRSRPNMVAALNTQLFPLSVVEDKT